MPTTSSANRRTIPLWRGLLVLLLGIVTCLALTPSPPAQLSLGWDKLNHAAAFAALASVAYLGFARNWVMVGVVLLGYGGLIELLQSFTPTRSAEWGDLLADGVGIALGLLLAAVTLVAKHVASRGSQR